jgi:sugar transferase (PEP-CTERM/EpsH1 system associated)
VRCYNLLRRIAAQHEVTLATHLHSPEDSEGLPHLRRICARVVTGALQLQSPLRHLPGLARYALKGWPLELKFRHSPELALHIAELLRGPMPDILQIEESRMALYSELLPSSPRTRRVLTFYDIAFAQSARALHLETGLVNKARGWLYAASMRRWEPRYAQRFDRCITVSDPDRNALLRANARLRVEVVPNGVDTHAYQPLPDALEGGQAAPALLFIGRMSYAPCVDAVIWFCREILPLVRQAIPSVELWLVGAEPTPAVLALQEPGVHVTGRVDDVRPYYARSAACVVPLRAGGGTRLKILEAMALGRAVVTTTIGCEGLAARAGEQLLVADGASAFADQTVRLLRDDALRAKLVAAGRQLVTTQYDWDALAEQQMRIYDQVLARFNPVARHMPGERR